VSPRRRLFRWAGWFALANAAVLGVVGLPYLWHYAALGRAVSWAYALVAYVGHLGVLACLPLLLVLVPVVAVIPRPRLVLPLGVVLAGAGAALLLLDTLIFAENRYHLDLLTLTLLEWRTWGFLLVYAVVALGIEAMLAGWVWRHTACPPRRRVGPYLALTLAACFMGSHLAHAWAQAHYDVSVTAFTRYLPLFYPLRNAGLLIRLGLVDRWQAREEGIAAAMGHPATGELNYPLAPLRCERPAPGLNLLLVVIDAMRADALTDAIAPRITAFARGAIRFDHHLSGGNASRAGLFSLFYGVPATYFDAFAGLAQPPVLIDLIRQRGDQIGIFASAPLYRLVDLDRTAFARLPELRRETRAGGGSSGRDRALTEEWIDWLGRRDPSRPFFGFLYYDAAVAIDPPSDYRPTIPVPPARVANLRLQRAQYLTAVHFVDSLVGRVLDDLRDRKLLERTVVIITSDHGMEFDDNGLGFRGHGTAYSDAQMRTPLVVHWPGRAPGRVTRRTSHNDIAPTLATELFGCANPPSDYASGWSLFTDAEWGWLVATSYREFAVIEPRQVTVVFAAGYEVRGEDYRLVPVQAPPRDALRAAMREMTRFYR
jgi:membrane-anchored protein YejM (alkaline phosphatase superfamily)